MIEMTPERWRRICQIRERMLDLPENRRSAFLHTECGQDADLRNEVESLIKAGARQHPELDFTDLGVDHFEDYKKIGEYQILSRIGRGGMGDVYCVWQESLKRKVAIKLIRSDLLEIGEARERFTREVEIVARLQHPAIVPVYAVGQHEGSPYFVMEYVHGCSLERVLDALSDRDPSTLRGSDVRDTVRKIMDEGTAGDDSDVSYLYQGTWESVCLRIAGLLANAIAHVHQSKILHRDIKPSNILLTSSGRVMLIDFGIARSETAETITAPDRQLHSLRYTPPERLKHGLNAADVRGDVYSLGAVLYRMLTLRHPFEGKSYADTARCIETGDIRGPRVFNSNLSRDTEAVCLLALDSDPAKRYQTVSEFAADLANAAENRPLLRKSAGLWSECRRWVRRRPAIAVALGASLIITIGGPALYGWQQSKFNDALHESILAIDVFSIKELKEQAESQLWPPIPENIIKMESWVTRVSRILERETEHQDRFEYLKNLKDASLETGVKLNDEGEFLKQLEQIRSLSGEAGTIASVKHRLQLAQNLQFISIDREIANWDRAIESIRNVKECPKYEGRSLVIRPQLGLVPLWRNPSTELWEFWHVTSGERPTDPLKPKASDGIILVLLPGGECTRGSNATDMDDPNYCATAPSKECPPQRVTLAPFFCAKYELTQAQYFRIMGNNPSRHKFNKEDENRRLLHPVEKVKFDEAAMVAKRLHLQIPTEAQWEYAARAGTSTPWPWASNLNNPPLNFADEDAAAVHTIGEIKFTGGMHDGAALHAVVGRYPPNSFGLYDMHGNVAEWCDDFAVTYKNAARFGDGRLDGEPQGIRYVRGGGFLSILDFTRSAHREDVMDDSSHEWVGIRMIRALD